MPLGKTNFSNAQMRASVNVVAKWSHAIDVGTDLKVVLTTFQELIGANTVQVVRQMLKFDRTRMVARQEVSTGKLFARPPRSFASALLGDLLHKSNLGSLFLMTEMYAGNEVSASLDQFGLQEVGVLSLSNEPDFSDFLEFHFDRPLPDHNRQLLGLLGSVLSQSWRDRTPGIVAALIAGQPFPTAHERGKEFENILSSGNPANLTRSEFRVCMLIQEGRLPDEVADILHVTKSTFRTHLRSIYFKTGVSGHVALVHLLHRSGSKVSDEFLRKGMRN